MIREAAGICVAAIGGASPYGNTQVQIIDFAAEIEAARKIEKSIAATEEFIAAFEPVSEDPFVATKQIARRYSNDKGLRIVGLSATDWEAIFVALVRAESAFHPDAVSPKGAVGLTQLLPGTARDLGVDIFNMEENLSGGAEYLLAQIARFRSLENALAAYNAGPSRVIEYGGVPPFAEAQKYVADILAEVKHPFAPSLANVSAGSEATPPPRSDASEPPILTVQFKTGGKG